MDRDIVARRRRHWIFAGLGALAILIFAWVLLHKAPAKAAGPEAIPVTVARATARDVPLSITALGAAQAWTSVSILAQVTGKLVTVNFTEGSDVKAGQVLAEIDPTPFQAALTQAQGALKRDEALLAEASMDLARFQRLEAENSIATQMVDDQAALVRQDQGVVLSDRGQVQSAQTNLDWCRIVSPIDGRVGVRFVDPGNIVSANTTASATSATTPTSTTTVGTGIVLVNQIEPIAVTFTVPEGDFQRLSYVSNGFSTPLQTRAYSQESGALLDTGTLSIADNRIDQTTGTVALKARFPNAARHLWPGQFVNVALTLQTLHNAVTIPQAAVNRGPDGNYVFVVDARNVVALRPVTLAWQQDAFAVVKSGLKAGETVVIDGQMTLKSGSLVRAVHSTEHAGS